MTRLRALGALLVVLVVLGVGGATTTVAFNQLNGPEQAVLDYASLIADGRASAAARRVAPASTKYGALVPRLVSDTALARATSRIRPLSAAVEDGAAGGADVAIGEVVTVDLTYGLGQQSGVAPLRVRREADGFPFTHKWRVLDPLLVPIVVQPNLRSLGAPTLAGVSLPLSRASAKAAQGSTGSNRPVLMYPGIYPLTTPSYQWLTAGVGDQPATLTAVHPANARTRPTVVTSALTWTATSTLFRAVDSGAVAALTKCVTDASRMSPDVCPAELYEERNRPGLANDLPPSGLVLGDVSNGVDGTVTVAFTYSTPAGVKWNGGASRRTFTVSGRVVFYPSDPDVTPVLSPA